MPDPPASMTPFMCVDDNKCASLQCLYIIENKQFAQKVIELLMNPMALNILGDVGKSYALQHWSASAKADQMLNFYRTVQAGYHLEKYQQTSKLAQFKH